jgi:hypothetical protein
MPNSVVAASNFMSLGRPFVLGMEALSPPGFYLREEFLLLDTFVLFKGGD